MTYSEKVTLGPLKTENADARKVIDHAEREDGNEEETGDEDDDDESGNEKVEDTGEEDTRSVIICDKDSSSDESDNITRINKSTICLILNKSQRFYPNGMDQKIYDTAEQVRDVMKKELDDSKRTLLQID